MIWVLFSENLFSPSNLSCNYAKISSKSGKKSKFDNRVEQKLIVFNLIIRRGEGGGGGERFLGH